MHTTQHAEARMRQRGIPEDLVDLILQYGTPRRRPGGAYEYVVRKGDRARLVRHLKHLLHRAEALDRKAVLVGDDGVVVTTYHLYA